MSDYIRREDALKTFPNLVLPKVAEAIKAIPSADVVSREELKSAENYAYECGYEHFYAECQNCEVRQKYEEAIAVKVDEVTEHLERQIPKPKTGEWYHSDDLYETLICSACGYDTEDYIKHNFCPECGAKMKGADDE